MIQVMFPRPFSMQITNKMGVLRIAGRVLIVIFTLILTYLAVVIFSPGFSFPETDQPLVGTAPRPTSPPPFREDVSFEVEGITVRGWFYLPAKAYRPAPCIVMAHGFGGTNQDMVMEKYASRYKNAGYAVMTFDYRFFGQSDGEPRQLFSRKSQLADVKNAIAYARRRIEVDGDRIALWGTSGSGGYGISIAADDPRIRAVVSHVPGLDEKADGEHYLERVGIFYLLRLFMHAQRDKGRSRFGLSPHYIPIVSRPGGFAVLNAPGAYEGYAKLIDGQFHNRVTARMFLEADPYDPISAAARVQVPVLFQIASKDNLVSPKSHERAAAALGTRALVKMYPAGHFEIYKGRHFESAVAEQIRFFEKTFEKNESFPR